MIMSTTVDFSSLFQFRTPAHQDAAPKASSTPSSVFTPAPSTETAGSVASAAPASSAPASSGSFCAVC